MICPSRNSCVFHSGSHSRLRTDRSLPNCRGGQKVAVRIRFWKIWSRDDYFQQYTVPLFTIVFLSFVMEFKLETKLGFQNLS